MLTTILCFVQANDFYDLPLGDDQGAISRFFTSGATGAVYHHTCECNWHHKYHECAVPSVVSLPTQFFLLQSAITAGLALRRGRHRTGARDMVGDGGASVTLAAPKAKKTGPQQSSIAQMFKRAAAASSCQAEVPGASSDQAENAATTPAQPSAQDALQSSTGPQALPGSVVPGSLSGEPAQRQEAAAFSGAASQCVGAAKGSEQASQDGKQTSQPVQQASSSQHRQEDSASFQYMTTSMILHTLFKASRPRLICLVMPAWSSRRVRVMQQMPQSMALQWVLPLQPDMQSQGNNPVTKKLNIPLSRLSTLSAFLAAPGLLSALIKECLVSVYLVMSQPWEGQQTRSLVAIWQAWTSKSRNASCMRSG